MSKFDEVSLDVLNALSKIEYEDEEKQIELFKIKYKINLLLISEENYKKGTKKLVKKMEEQKE